MLPRYGQPYIALLRGSWADMSVDQWHLEYVKGSVSI